MTKRKIVRKNEVILPISNFNISIEDTSLYATSSNDHYLTSAYCARDKIQWIYLRDIVRGLSYSEDIGCPSCKGKLIIGNSDTSHISSSNLLEVVGWLQVKRKVLDLAIIESYFGDLKGSLLQHLQEHTFSKSIKAGRLLQGRYFSHVHRTRRPVGKLLLTTLNQRFSLNHKTRKSSINLKNTLEEDMKSPLRRPENLQNHLSADQFEQLRKKKPLRSLMTKNLHVDETSLKNFYATSTEVLKEKRAEKHMVEENSGES